MLNPSAGRALAALSCRPRTISGPLEADDAGMDTPPKKANRGTPEDQAALPRFVKSSYFRSAGKATLAALAWSPFRLAASQADPAASH